jgi:hypothetical protein
MVMSHCTSEPAIPGRLGQRSTRIVFFNAGLGVAAVHHWQVSLGYLLKSC